MGDKEEHDILHSACIVKPETWTEIEPPVHQVPRLSLSDMAKSWIILYRLIAVYAGYLGVGRQLLRQGALDDGVGGPVPRGQHVCAHLHPRGKLPLHHGLQYSAGLEFWFYPSGKTRM